MSFEKLTHDELLVAAELFAVDLATSMDAKKKVNPKLAVAAFAEEGVTFDMYSTLIEERAQAVAELEAQEQAERELEEQRTVNVVKEQQVLDNDDVDPVEDSVVVPRRKRPRSTDILVKMDRNNPHYEVVGKIFTRDHPFVLMTEDEAQDIFDIDNGFRVATPREAAEYYS